MPLGVGTRLGPYEITGAIGAGGMGEVYRARDTRLERQVAIKVLPEHLSANPQLRERFEREAKVISGLSHAHICTLYDVGRSDDREYLVMELVEGESLAARLERGPMPPEQAVRIAIAVASALDKAHRSGIIHRDLKPANIMLARDGAKLLDFGLAKLKPQPIAVAAAALTEMTADDRKLTAEGTIVGTFQYMAPEQLEGGEADPRTDIFALGAVLYEMLTGRAAFQGKTKASLIASILSAEPAPISSIQPASPPALDRVIRACIAKDPADRIQTAHDLKLQLEMLADSGSQFGVAAAPLAAKRRIPAWALGVAALLAMAVIAAAVWLSLRDQAEAPVMRSAIPLPEGVRLPRSSQQVLALSRDGRSLVYTGINKNQVQLYLRRLGEFGATPIAGTDFGFAPAISPDGEWVAFMGHDRKFFKVRLSGGAPLQLGSRSDGVGLDWGDDGNIYLAIWAIGVFAVPADGGEARQVTTVGAAPDDRSHVWPQLLPGGKHLLFTVWTGKSFDDARVEAVELATGQRTVLVRGGTYGRYLPSGHLVYSRSGSLLAQALDVSSLRTSGAPFPVLEGVHTGAANGEARFAVAPNGTLAYVPGSFSPVQRELVLIDRTGKATRVTEQARPFADVAVSPDGRQIAATLETSTFDVWVLDRARDTLTKVTFGGDDSDPLWTPDGRSLLYASSTPGQPELFLKRLDSGDPPRRLTDQPSGKNPCCWLDGGRRLLYTITPRGGTRDIWVLSLEGDPNPQPLLATEANEEAEAVSPDGKWLLYVSDKSGRPEVYARAVSGQSREWQISRDGGVGAFWMPNGREIVFGGSNVMWSVSVQPGADLNPSRPLKLFEDPNASSEWESVTLAPDGRFLVSREAGQASDQADILLVQNWFSELRAARR